MMLLNCSIVPRPLAPKHHPFYWRMVLKMVRKIDVRVQYDWYGQTVYQVLQELDTLHPKAALLFSFKALTNICSAASPDKRFFSFNVPIRFFTVVIFFLNLRFCCFRVLIFIMFFLMVFIAHLLNRLALTGDSISSEVKLVRNNFLFIPLFSITYNITT